MEFEEDSKIVPDVHRIGFVWATMLWDLHWQYAAKYGYSSDVTADVNRWKFPYFTACYKRFKTTGL